MPETERPQIYLISPPVFDDSLPDRLAVVLDAVPVACLRLAFAERDADALRRAVDACRVVAHDRDVAVVVEGHLMLVGPLGLDGVHLTDGARSVRAARKELGADAIVGAHCGVTRHEGISAAEAGADYVAFGPAGVSALGDGKQAEAELFQWWSEMIEVPCVAEGALTPELVAALAPVVDFVALGHEVWGADDPVAALRRFAAALG
jgi:thiamine-phosphate pyrophosphorylase